MAYRYNFNVNERIDRCTTCPCFVAQSHYTMRCGLDKNIHLEQLRDSYYGRTGRPTRCPLVEDNAKGYQVKKEA